MKRHHVIFIVALAALIGSLVSLFASYRDRDFALRGYVDATRDSNLPFRVPRLGVNADLDQYTPNELTFQLEQMKTAQIIWVRQIFSWDEIEPTQGEFDWTKWDAIVAALDEHPNMQIVAVLFYSPEWARNSDASENRTAPPERYEDFTAYASAFALRYSDSIDYYQIWDEPNLTDAWGGLEPRAVEYLALLQPAYDAIHSADPTSAVIAGGLAPTTETGPKNVSDIIFLSDLYALGAKDYMDAVGAKPHGFNDTPLNHTVDTNVLNFSRIIALREEMVRNGDAHKPLWAVSWGWNSLPDDWNGNPSIWGSVTLDQQVTYTLDALNRAEREWPWLAGMILQTWQPDAPMDDPRWGFSLLDAADNPKPLWTALSQRSIPASATNGLYPATNSHTRYSGVWEFGTLGADIGWLRDSQFAFDFQGTDVALLLREDDYVAYLYPTIDEKPANSLPKDANGNAYIVLKSDSLQPELSLVPVATGLSDEQHTLAAIADRGWDRWAIAGYAVSSGNLTAPFEQQISIAWLTVSVTSVATLVTARQLQWSALLARLKGLWEGLNASSQIAISAVTSATLMFGMLLTWGDSTPNILKRETVQIGLSVLSAGILYLEPPFVLTILAAVVLFLIFYHAPVIGLALTILWSPFFLFPVELYHFAFPIVEIIILLTAGAWLLRTFADWGCSRQSSVSQFPSMPVSERIRQLRKMDFAVIVWLGLGLLSLLWTQYRAPAITELRVMMLEPALLYLIFRTTPLRKHDLLRLVDALLIAGIIVAVIGLIIYSNPASRITAEGGAQRLTSVYGSPNNVGLFLGRCIPFLLNFLILKLDKRRRMFAGIAFIPIAPAIILSQSVGALFIGIPAAVASVILLIFGKRALLPLLGLAVIGVISFIIALQFPRFARVLDLNEGTNFFRIRVWQSSIDLIQDHPITGVGLDQFLYVFRGQYIRPDAEAEPNLSHPHNFILDFWTRLGILGVGLFLWMQALFWKNARVAYTELRKKDPLLFAIAVGMVGSMINLITHGLIDNSIYVIDLAYVFMLLLGLSVVLTNIRAIDAEFS